jgi:hypothetical protein
VVNGHAAPQQNRLFRAGIPLEINPGCLSLAEWCAASSSVVNWLILIPRIARKSVKPFVNPTRIEDAARVYWGNQPRCGAWARVGGPTMRTVLRPRTPDKLLKSFPSVQLMPQQHKHIRGS